MLRLMQGKLSTIGVAMLVASILSVGGIVSAQQVQTTTGTLIDSTITLVGAFTGFAVAIGGILAIFVPYMKGKAKEKAALVASELLKSDQYAVYLSSLGKTNKAKIELIEQAFLNLSNLTDEQKAQYDILKKKLAEKEDQITSEVEKDTAEVEAIHSGLSGMIDR